MGVGPPKNSSVKFGANVGNNNNNNNKTGRAGSPNERAFRKGSMVEQNGLVFKKPAANLQRRGYDSFSCRLRA